MRPASEKRKSQDSDGSWTFAPLHVRPAAHNDPETENAEGICDGANLRKALKQLPDFPNALTQVLTLPDA